jgi:hypothetical protein
MCDVAGLRTLQLVYAQASGNFHLSSNGMMSLEVIVLYFDE